MMDSIQQAKFQRLVEELLECSLELKKLKSQLLLKMRDQSIDVIKVPEFTCSTSAAFCFYEQQSKDMEHLILRQQALEIMTYSTKRFVAEAKLISELRNHEIESVCIGEKHIRLRRRLRGNKPCYFVQILIGCCITKIN